MSSFRLICIAALTVATTVFVDKAAAAQTPAGANQSGKPYLAGLPPPHEHHKAVHAKTAQADAQQQATAKTARPATKSTTTTANAKPHRPARLAEKINSHVAWPSVEPAAADEPATPPTALQFATDDAAQVPFAPPRSPAPITAATKISPPAKVAAPVERDTIDSASATPPATAHRLVQIERYQAPTVTRHSACRSTA